MCNTVWNIINSILAIWGLISLIAVIISFFIDNFDNVLGVNLIDSPDEELLNTLHLYYEYPKANTSYEHTLIYSNEYPIKNIKIYEYIDQTNKLTKSTVIEKSLPPNYGLLLHIDRPEGYATHKISWQIEYGAIAEYVFKYNGATGNYDTSTHKYYYNIISKFRKILGVK